MITQIKDMEYFLEFFNREGLSIEGIIASERLIPSLHIHLGRFWKSGSCRYLDSHTEEANRIRVMTGTDKYFEVINNKRFQRKHYYWASQTDDGIFVLDPTGVPIDLKKQRENILPYFGLQEYATGSYNEIYSQMEDIDEWGTRDLPPGFHP